MRKSYLVYSALATFSLTLVAAIPIKNASAQEIPKAECRESSSSGKVACGYNCVESSSSGKVVCAEWAGGVCKESSSSGQVICGPPAPPDWMSGYSNNSNSNNHNSGIYGAWAVEMNRWSGLMRMNGNHATLVLVDNQNHVVEQKMQLKRDSQNGYILDGDVISTNIGKYWADNFYIQQFLKETMTVKNCDDKKESCVDVTLTYLGN